MAIKASAEITILDETDATGLVMWYHLTTSATAPSKPSTTDATATPSGWSQNEPTFSAGDATNYLYTCLQLIWGDGTCSWGNVQLSSSYEQAKQAWNAAQAAAGAASTALADSVEYIVGTQTASTGSWTGVTRDASLVAGKTIAYKLPYAGSGNASLNLTLSGGGTTGAIAVYAMTTRVTTHYPAGSIIQMTYDGTYWRTTGWYYSNNIDRTQHNNTCKAGSVAVSGSNAIVSGSVIGYVDSAGGYQTIVGGTVVNLTKPILWGSGAVAAGATFTNAYEVYPSCSLRNNNTAAANNNADWSGTTYEMAYLVGTLNGAQLTCSSPLPFTSTIPDQPDDNVYIPVGQLYSGHQVAFRTSKDLYGFVNGMFQYLGVGMVQVVSTRVEEEAQAWVLAVDSVYTVANGAKDLADDAKDLAQAAQGDISSLANKLTARMKFTGTDAKPTLTLQTTAASTKSVFTDTDLTFYDGDAIRMQIAETATLPSIKTDYINMGSIAIVRRSNGHVAFKGV